ncbi:MAG: glutaminase A [Tissierellia bacterium]|nr:glutaminase A [Tissierellia bacterium]
MKKIDLELLLEECLSEGKKVIKDGNVADYIPELKNVNKENIGIHLYTLDNEEYSASNEEFTFSMQSVVKIVLFALALMDNELDRVLSKVGVKPSADPFNSIVKLEETEDHKPLNPFINAGAIASTSLIAADDYQGKFDRVIALLEKLFDRESIEIDEKVFISESTTGDTNRALAYFMKSRGILDKEEDVEELLSIYFKSCSILASTRDLSKLGAVLANKGKAPWSGEQIIPERINQIVCAVMTTCGLYDYSGEFAVIVGMPAKSGVGGGIVCVSHNNMGIGVSSPALDSHGNSIAGIEMLRVLSNKLDISIF